MPETADPKPSAPELHEARTGIQWASIVRNTALVAVLLVLVWMAFNVRLPSVDELRTELGKLGAWAWAAFIVLYAVVVATPIPVTIMSTAAGVLFGVAEGSLLALVGAFFGSWMAYWLARLLGKQTVTKLLGHHADTVEEHLENAGSQAVYLLRLMPGLPYWPVNYGAGAFGISQRDFLVGSTLGGIPGQISLVALGAFIAQPNAVTGAIVATGWATAGILALLAYRKMRQQSAARKSDGA